MIIIPSTISFLSGACGQGTGSGRTVRNGEHHGDVNVVPREHEVAASDDSNKVSSRWNIMKFYHASMKLAYNTHFCVLLHPFRRSAARRVAPLETLVRVHAGGCVRACLRACVCMPACAFLLSPWDWRMRLHKQSILSKFHVPPPHENAELIIMPVRSHTDTGVSPNLFSDTI